METVTDFIFLGYKITAGSYFNHEIKRYLLLGRKAMTNLDSIWKSRDITLPTKVHIVKAMVFSVVLYGCESWIIRTAECWRIDALELWYWRLLWIPCCKEINPVNPNGNQSWIFTGRIDAEAETPILWPPDAKILMLGKLNIEHKRRRGRQRITDAMDISLSKLQETVKDKEAWHAAIGGVTKSRTGLSDWTTIFHLTQNKIQTHYFDL